MSLLCIGSYLISYRIISVVIEQKPLDKISFRAIRIMTIVTVLTAYITQVTTLKKMTTICNDQLTTNRDWEMFVRWARRFHSA